jgi:DNA helicase-2/ATP-dependent DNA helicase PcrA
MKKKASAKLRRFVKTWPDETPLKWYQQFLQSLPAEYGVEPKKKKNEIDLEDLAPLISIQHRFFGVDVNEVYDHIVIDEAQDVSPYQLGVLKKHCRGTSFTILGDLLQNIYSFRGIKKWHELTEVLDEGKVRKFELNTSYRSTMEIIRFANQVVSKYAGDVALAKPVYRSGEPVKVIRVNMEDRIKKLLQLLEQTFDRIHSLAIVTRTEGESRMVYEQLLANGWQPNLILSGQNPYQGGLSILPVYLTKGMEFDAVVMMDIDEHHYPDDELNAKLLFVGCTRALHQLYLLCHDPCSPLVEQIPTDLYQAL